MQHLLMVGLDRAIMPCGPPAPAEATENAKHYPIPEYGDGNDTKLAASSN